MYSAKEVGLLTYQFREVGVLCLDTVSGSEMKINLHVMLLRCEGTPAERFFLSRCWNLLAASVEHCLKASSQRIRARDMIKK